MSDSIIRGTAADSQVRFFAAVTRDTIETARRLHDTSPVVTAALGRLLTAGAMMGCMSKQETDLTTLQIQCDGPIGGLVVTADGASRVKGYARQPRVALPANQLGKLDVGGAVGHGILSVIRDVGLKEPYTGQTQLVSGEIAEDLTSYFAVSEQIPSSVALGVLVDRDHTVRQAGGFILQLMPFAEDSLIDTLEERLGSLPAVTAMLDEGLTPEAIIERILDGYELHITEKRPTAWYCGCSKERFRRAVMSIRRADLEDMIADGKPIEVCCHFCGAHYVFEPEELKKMLE